MCVCVCLCEGRPGGYQYLRARPFFSSNEVAATSCTRRSLLTAATDSPPLLASVAVVGTPVAEAVPVQAYPTVVDSAKSFAG